VGFGVDKAALEQVFSQHFAFPCQSTFHQLLRNHHHLTIIYHLSLVQEASSGRSTKWTQSHPTKNNKK
jgi:hypothetical protein